MKNLLFALVIVGGLALAVILFIVLSRFWLAVVCVAVIAVIIYLKWRRERY